MIPTCLDYFIKSCSTFAIIEDRIWTVHKSRIKPNNYISLDGNAYSLEESEEISTLELECYSNNKMFFEEYITRMLKERLRSKSDEMMDLNNVFSEIQENSNERTVLYNAMIEYFNLYNHKTSLPEIKTYNEFGELYTPALKELETTYPLLKPLYGKGILFFNGSVYDLNRGPIRDRCVVFKGKKFSLDPRKNTDEILTNYRGIIERFVQEKFKDKNLAIKRTLTELKERLKILQQDIKSYKRSLNNSSIGEIGYRQRGDYYQIYVDIEPFIYKHLDKRFIFGKTRAAIDALFHDDKALLVKKPYIAEEFMSYNHPFVYSDGDICIGDENFIEGRFKDKNIYFNKEYDIKRHNISRRIAICLSEAKQVIEDGYIGELKPVKRLENPNNFRDELLKSNDLRTSCIPKSRIFPKDGI